MPNLIDSSSRRTWRAGAWVLAAVAAYGCGPNVSGFCPSPTPGAGVSAQNESSPSESVEPKAAVATEPAHDAGAAAAAAVALTGDGGAAVAHTGDGGAAAVAVAAPAAPAAPTNFNIAGVVKVGAEGTRPAKFAVVYLEDAPKDPTRGMKTSIDQRMMMFVPYVAAVAAGGTVTFVNSDPFPHNVFSPGGEKFDLGTLNKGGVGRYTFKKPGPYTLLCNVHPGMLGYIYVAPSNYFAITNGQGEFTIKSVPEGTYKIAAWAPKMGAPAKPVVVKGADTKIELAIEKL